MSGGSLYLVDSCSIERYVDEIDNYNNRRRVPMPHLQAVPCRYIETGKTFFNSVTGESVKVSESKILVLANADIETGDRINNIVTQENIVIDGIFEVDSGSFIRRGRMLSDRTLLLNKVS